MKNDAERPRIVFDAFWAQLAGRFEVGAIFGYVLMLIMRPNDLTLWGLPLGAVAIASVSMIVEICFSKDVEAHGDPLKATAVMAATLAPIVAVVVSWGLLSAPVALAVAVPVSFAWYVWGRVLAPRQYPGPIGRVTLIFLVLSGAMVAIAALRAAYTALG